MLKAILFDVDGTLIDTEAIQSDAYLKVLKTYGINSTDLTEHGTVHIAGETTETTWEKLKARHGINANIDELTSKKRQATMDLLHASKLVPMPGVETLFSECKLRGVKLAVVSSAQVDRLALIIDGLGLTKYIDIMVSANDVHNVKPHPEPYIVAAEKLGVSPEECVVVEDSVTGVKSAKAAGMKVIAVPNEYTRRMDFSLADKRVDSIEELSESTLYSLI